MEEKWGRNERLFRSWDVIELEHERYAKVSVTLGCGGGGWSDGGDAGFLDAEGECGSSAA